MLNPSRRTRRVLQHSSVIALALHVGPRRGEVSAHAVGIFKCRVYGTERKLTQDVRTLGSCSWRNEDMVRRVLVRYNRHRVWLTGMVNLCEMTGMDASTYHTRGAIICGHHDAEIESGVSENKESDDTLVPLVQ